MADHPVKLRFAYTFSDWLHAVRCHQRFTRGFFINKLVAIFSFAMGCLSLWWQYRPSLGTFVFIGVWDRAIPLFLFFASIAIWFDLATWFGIRTRYWRKRNEPRKVHVFIFDDNGAEFKTGDPATVQVKLTWNEFRKVRESKQVFILILKDNGFWAIPKRYLTESGQMNAFRELVTEKIN